MNLKLHLLVSAVFLLLIFGALLAFSMKPNTTSASTATPEGDRFIQIASATWGENCNGAITSMREQAATSVAAPPTSTPADPIPELVQKDNALRAVSSMCNGKIGCQFLVDPASLGFQPIKKCRKEMIIEYRCFEVDRLQETRTQDDDALVINCQETSEPTP